MHILFYNHGSFANYSSIAVIFFIGQCTLRLMHNIIIVLKLGTPAFVKKIAYINTVDSDQTSIAV